MTTHAVLVVNSVAAKNIDSYNRSAVSSSDVDNGNIVILTTHGAATGNSEVWTAVPASTSAGLTDIWMVADPELVWTGSYRGLDPDPRNFYVVAGRIFSIYKPQLHDIFTLTAAGIYGSVNTYINAGNTGQLKPEWASGIGSSVFAAKLIATNYVSLGTGAMDDQRAVSYQFEVVHV
jgi:hypothetical protein